LAGAVSKAAGASVERHEVLTVGGVDVVRYVRSGVKSPWADRAVLLIPVERAVPLILDAMPGWQFVPDVDEDSGAAALTQALLDAGATISRHALGFTYPLDSADVPSEWGRPHLPSDAELAPITAVTDELVELIARAFPPGHPDHAMDDWDLAEGLETLVVSQKLGPLLEETAQVVRGGRPMAALIINRFTGEPPYGGPWISDIFRDPDDADARGLGTALIRRALVLLAARGEPALSLAVTYGNPAAEVYARIGFQQAWDVVRLKLPGDVVPDPA
jgi:GNAT superfamily N-acetyltransferase